MDEHPANMKWSLEVDHRERSARLSELVQQSDLFEIHFDTLKAGDYLLQRTVLIERKTLPDLAASVIDGRLFTQAAKLARGNYRALFLITTEVTKWSSLPSEIRSSNFETNSKS